MTSLRFKRAAAWTVWLAVALLVIAILLGLIGWGVVSQQHASARKDQQMSTLIGTINADHHAAELDRATAAANQRALLDYTATLAARQDALLAYLRAHGIHLPQRLVTVVPRPRIIVRHHHAHRSGSRTRHRSTSTSGTTRVPSGPGKSGSAPGHRKHRPH